jgi:hypothetical protein
MAGMRGIVLALCLGSGAESAAETPVPSAGPGCDDAIGALVCDAARLQAADPKRASALLGQALDKEEPGYFAGLNQLYSRFAEQPTLNLEVLRFLRAQNLDLDSEGRALDRQIGRGSVENVRQLLELGANPNERHGSQHAALASAREALADHPAEALEIARVLLQYGADPNMLLSYEDAEQPKASNADEQAFEKLMKDSMGPIAARTPVRVDFYDFEPSWGADGVDYARFFVLNNTEKEWNLGIVRDVGGIEYSGPNVALEYVVWPGTRWRTYTWTTQDVKDPSRRSAHLDGWALSLLRVPVNLYELMDAPPGLRLRLRIRASDGSDFVSAPFALHDSRYVREQWPESARVVPPNEAPPQDKDSYGKPIMLPRATDIPGGPAKVERDSAPHSHSMGPGKGASTN